MCAVKTAVMYVNPVTLLSGLLGGAATLYICGTPWPCLQLFKSAPVLSPALCVVHRACCTFVYTHARLLNEVQGWIQLASRSYMANVNLVPSSNTSYLGATHHTDTTNTSMRFPKFAFMCRYSCRSVGEQSNCMVQMFDAIAYL